MPQTPILLLGVTGGIASGKTTVTDMLQELGAIKLEFDILARTVQQKGKPAYRDILDYFGRQVLLENGELDRKKIAELVFKDPEKKHKLETFTHPRIFEEYSHQIEILKDENPGAIIQVVVPLLFEANMQSMFDRLLVVYIPEQDQLKRLMQRDGISQKQALRIINSQLPIEKKRELADFVIDNSGSVETTRQQAEELWQEIRSIQTEGLY